MHSSLTLYPTIYQTLIDVHFTRRFVLRRSIECVFSAPWLKRNRLHVERRWRKSLTPSPPLFEATQKVVDKGGCFQGARRRSVSSPLRGHRGLPLRCHRGHFTWRLGRCSPILAHCAIRSRAPTCRCTLFSSACTAICSIASKWPDYARAIYVTGAATFGLTVDEAVDSRAGGVIAQAAATFATDEDVHILASVSVGRDGRASTRRCHGLSARDRTRWLWNMCFRVKSRRRGACDTTRTRNASWEWNRLVTMERLREKMGKASERGEVH